MMNAIALKTRSKYAQNAILLVITFLTYYASQAQAPPQVDPCGRTFLNFDGTNDYLAVDGASTINGTEGTWEAWVRKDDWTGAGYDHGVLFGNAIPFTSANALFLSFHAVVGLHFRYGGSEPGAAAIFRDFDDFSDTESFEPGSWHHIAATWKPSATAGNTDLAIFIDGEETASGMAALQVSVGHVLNFGLSVESLDMAHLEAGSMVDIRTWEVARTAGEITNDMNTRLVGDEIGLTGYWPVDDSEGSVSIDNLAPLGSLATLVGFDATTAWEMPAGGLGITLNGTDISNGGSFDFMQRPIGVASEESFLLSNPTTATINFTNAPVFSLSGPDASLFIIDESAIVGSSLAPGQSVSIPVSFSPTAAVTSTATFTLHSDDPCGNSTYVLTLMGEGVVNNFPVFETASSLDVYENRLMVIDINANDGDGGEADENITYSISGGADAALFVIEGITGQLTFTSSPDFEVPSDQEADNNYEIIVQASDGTLSSNQTLVITVLDVEDVIFSFEGSGAPVTVGGITRTLLIGEILGTRTNLASNNGEYQFLTSFDHPVRIPRVIMAATQSGRDVTATVVNDSYQSETFFVPFGSGNEIDDLTLKTGDLYPENDQLRMTTDIQKVGVARITAEILPAFSNADTITITDGTNLSVVNVNTFKPGGVGEAGITYSIENTNAIEGIDGGFFNIDPASGALSFNDMPTGRMDADRDNNLQVIVLANDGPNTARLAITVVLDGLPVAPLLNPIGDQMVDELATLSFTAMATDEDTPTGLVYSIDPASEGKGMTIGGATGNFSWMPGESQDGDHTVVFSVSDGERSDIETITITVNEVNTQPQFPMMVNREISEGVELTFTVTATDADIPANTLTYSIDQASIDKGMTIDPVSGVFSWTPTEEQVFPIVYFNVEDGEGLADLAIIGINVLEVNEAPVLTAIGNQSITENTELTFTASASDADLPANTLTFSLDVNSVGKGMAIDPATGAFSWTPTTMQAGDHSVTLTVTDDGVGMLTDFETFTVTVRLNQTITFNALANKTFGDADFDLIATGGASGNPVTYISSDETVATISGNKVTIIGAGTTTITASQLGNANYNAASNVQQVLTVDKSSQAITFNALSSRTYGAASFELEATATSGLTISYSSSDETVASVSGSTVTIVGAGNTTITASQTGDEDYNPAISIPQTLTVGQASLTATADNQVITFGESLPTFTISYTGFVNGDTEVALDTPPTVGTAATGNGGSDADTYAITLTGGTDNNYDLTLTDGTLTINKADQTITFDAIADIDIATTTGVALNANSDAGLDVVFTLVAGDGSITGSTLMINSTGSFTVEATQSGNKNYNAATAVRQSFTVTDSRKTDQTIDFPVIANKFYGGVFTLTATASSNLPVSYEVISGPAIVSGEEVQVVGVGTVTIEASQGGDDSFNEATSVTQSFEANKATLTVTVDDQMRAYNTDNPTLTISYGGFIGSDVETDLDELPAVSTTAEMTSDAGSYAINLSGGNDNNYDFELVDGTLTIAKATASITLSDLEQEADGTAREPTVTTTPADLNIEITYESESAPTTPGSYDFTATIVETNYEGEEMGMLILTGETLGFADEVVVSVYPNPAQDYLRIDSESSLQVEVMDLAGKAILKSTSEDDIDISQLSSGTYLLKLTNEAGKTETIRFIKSN